MSRPGGILGSDLSFLNSSSSLGLGFLNCTLSRGLSNLLLAKTLYALPWKEEPRAGGQFGDHCSMTDRQEDTRRSHSRQ